MSDNDYVDRLNCKGVEYDFKDKDISNYYTKEQVNELIQAIIANRFKIVETLPETDISPNTIYLVAKTPGKPLDGYTEYLYIENEWEVIGSTQADMSDYFTKSEINTKLAQKQDLLTIDTALSDTSTNPVQNKAISLAVDEKADSTDVAEQLLTKADKSEIPTKLSDLTNDGNYVVDSNYVHTDNNFTTTEKGKLAEIEEGAEKNVQPDWNETDTDSNSYINNKPSKLSDFTNDEGFIDNEVNNLLNYYSKTEIDELKARYDESLRSDNTKFPTYEYDGLTLKACSIRNYIGTSYSTCLSTYSKTGTPINYVYQDGSWSDHGPLSYAETLLPVSRVIGDLMFSSFLMQMNPDYYKKTESYNKTEVDALLNLINSKIPSQASSTNQLADKDFVNSTVGTNTSNYISNNGQPFTSLAQLQAYTGTVTNNDYAFVTGTDEQGNTYYDRYKATVSGSSKSWAKEYRLNNSSFTASQWAAISSGIDGDTVTSFNNHLSATNNPHSVTKSQVGLGNVTNVATESTITSGSTKNITSGAVYTALQGKVNTTDTIAVAHGGTGQTTAKGGQYALLGSMNEVTGTPSDSSMWIGRYDSPSASSGAVYYRKFLELWNYIKGKINGNYDIPANKHYGNPSGTTRYIKIDLRDTKASILVSVAYQGSIWFDRNNSNPYRLDSSSYGVTGWAWSSREGTTDKNVLWLKVASYRDISITIPSLTMSQVGTDITATGVQVVFNAWTTTAPTGITFGTTVNQVDTVSARNSALNSYYKAGDDLQINSIGCDGNIEIRNTDSILSVFDIDCTSIDTNGNPITCGKLTSSKVVIPIKASTYTGTDNGEIWIG